MGEIRVKTADSFLTLPSHQKTSNGWKDIPTHTMTVTGWQGELTSQSPLEFRATGRSLLDWRVEGRTSENLIDNWEYGDIDASGNPVDATYSMRTGYIPIEVDKIYSISREITIGYWKVRIYDKNKTYIGSGTNNIELLWNIGGLTPANPMQNGASFTKIKPIVENGYFMRFICSDVNFSENAMMIEGDYIPSTIPPYEPYGGVGVRTENLFDPSVSPVNYAMGEPDEQNRAQVVQVPKSRIFIFPIDNSSAKTFTVKIYSDIEVSVLRIAFTDTIPLSNYQYVYDMVQVKTTSNPQVTTTNNGLRQYLLVQIGKIGLAYLEEYGTIGVMLTEGSTAPSTYIPYGYKIPVTVGGVTTNLYTTAQLMDGDSLDYTTDQTIIPITQGDNTLTVGTQVQPKSVFVKFEG